MVEILLKTLTFFIENWEKISPQVKYCLTIIYCFFQNNIFIISLTVAFLLGGLLTLFILDLIQKNKIPIKQPKWIIEYIDNETIYHFYFENKRLFKMCEKCKSPIDVDYTCTNKNCDKHFNCGNPKSDEEIKNIIDLEIHKKNIGKDYNLKFHRYEQ